MLAAQATPDVLATLRSNRRPSNDWRNDRSGRPDRTSQEARGPYPRNNVVGENLETKMERINSRWTHSERQLRRLQALRKQEELMLLLAGDDIESLLRAAVADGEQPVCSPECSELEV